MKRANYDSLGLAWSLGVLALVVILGAIHWDLSELNKTLQHIEVSIVAAVPDGERE